MKLIVLAPGHFHAALLQKTMYPNVDATVHVYAEDGPDLADYLQKIAGYNARAEAPTAWRMQVHAGADFLDRFSAEQGRRRGRHRRQQPAQGRIRDPRGGRRHARARRQADGHRHRGLRVAAAGVRRRQGPGRAALRHHDRAARDHHDAAEGVLAHSLRVRRTAAGLRARAGRRQGERAPLFQAGVRRAGQAAGVVLRRGAAGRRPRRHHHAPRRSRAVGVLPRRDPGFREGHPRFSARSAGPP